MTAFFYVNCPHCGSSTQVGFQQGYTTNAAPQCSRCGRQFLVRYSWPGGHSEPTIYEVKK
jgi:transposase-like protein